MRGRFIETEQKLEIISSHLTAKKAENIEVLDLRGRTLMADYFVICSGTSDTHIRALADSLLVDAKADGLLKNHVEGYADARWVLVDYGDVVVHIFAQAEREYYDIESLWRATLSRLESTAG